MRFAAALSGAAAALALVPVGCGTSSAPPDGRPPGERDAKLERLISDCGLPSGRAVDAGPAGELMPPHAQVAAIQESDDGYQATAALAYPPGAALAAMLPLARQAGHEVVGSENEGFEAELFLQSGDGATTVRIVVAPRCYEASRAAITFKEMP